MQFDVRKEKQVITEIVFANQEIFSAQVDTLKPSSVDQGSSKGINLYDSNVTNSELFLYQDDYENFIRALKKAEELGWLPKVLTVSGSRTVLQE